MKFSRLKVSDKLMGRTNSDDSLEDNKSFGVLYPQFFFGGGWLEPPLAPTFTVFLLSNQQTESGCELTVGG